MLWHSRIKCRYLLSQPEQLIAVFEFQFQFLIFCDLCHPSVILDILLYLYLKMCSKSNQVCSNGWLKSEWRALKYSLTVFMINLKTGWIPSIINSVCTFDELCMKGFWKFSYFLLYGFIDPCTFWVILGPSRAVSTTLGYMALESSGYPISIWL